MNEYEEFIKNIHTYYKDELKRYTDEFKQDFYVVSNEVNDLFFKEINRIYDRYIKEYYTYETDFYVRHFEPRAGTKKGTNLYYGNQNKIHRGKDPYWEIIYNGKDMADDYRHDSADKVLENVVFGIRGVPPYWQKTWGAKYKSRYFSIDRKVSLLEAFTRFQEKYVEIMEPVFMRRWKKRRKNK